MLTVRIIKFNQNPKKYYRAIILLIFGIIILLNLVDPNVALATTMYKYEGARYSPGQVKA